MGDVWVQKGTTLTLKGNVWVVGKIVFESSGSSVHDSLIQALGPGAKVMIADDGNDSNDADIIDMAPNYDVQGSCTDCSSYVLLVSMSRNMDTSAMPYAVYASNNSNSLVLAAPNGSIRVKQGGEAKAMASKQLHLEQGSHVVYSPALGSFYVSPNGNYTFAPDPNNPWQEL